MIYGLRDASEALIWDVDASAWATYKQSGTALPSDLTDAQWERLEPLIPAAKPGGRPRKTDMRAAMNAIFLGADSAQDFLLNRISKRPRNRPEARLFATRASCHKLRAKFPSRFAGFQTPERMGQP